MSTNTLDDILAGGGKTATFPTIGTSYSGPVTSVEVRQATNFDTGKPEFWDDGNPKKQAVVSIQTAERADADDDGVRAIYINLWGDKLKALRAAKASPQPGDTFTATYIGDGEKPARGYAPKLFKYTIVKGNPLDSALGVQTVNSTPAAPAEQFPPALTDSQKDLALQLINVGGQTNEQIAQIINAPANLIAALREPANDQARLQAAAASGSGF